MNGNGAGQGVTVLLGLFYFMIMFCLRMMFYMFAAAVGIVYLMLMGIRQLYRHRQARKLAAQETAELLDPPMPVMNKVE